MDYDNAISDVVRIVEAVGAGIMVVGGFGAFIISSHEPPNPSAEPAPIRRVAVEPLAAEKA